MSEVTRRGVLRAGVWGVPVVAVAVAAPAAAASDQPRVVMWWSPVAITIGRAEARLNFINDSLVDVNRLTVMISGLTAGLNLSWSGNDWQLVAYDPAAGTVVFAKVDPLPPSEAATLFLTFSSEQLPPGTYSLPTTVISGATAFPDELVVRAV